MKFNIYYESLEQGLFYIKENLQKINPSFEINLVNKRRQTYSSNGFKANYSKSLSNILIRKNPDLIFSCIVEGIEYPIIVLEFSTAVFTKDHEQQRADNFLIPINNNCVYVKVSPLKKDSGNHGGDTNYNYLEPFALCYQKYKEISFHINWDVEENNNKYVKKHSIYRSLPNTNTQISELLKLTISIIIDKGVKQWKAELFNSVENNPLFTNWVNSLKNLKKFEDIKNINSSRTYFETTNKFINKNNVFTLKLNRMGHAMDPERGMLAYYNTFLKNKNMTIVSKFVFSKNSDRWYKATPKEDEIKSTIRSIKKIDKNYLIEFLVKGLSIHNGETLISLVRKSKNNIINIDNYLKENYSLINNSFRTIIDHSTYLQLSDDTSNIVFLTWSKIEFNFNLSQLNYVTKLCSRKTISEDDITFLTIHEVFKKNNITPLSVSYPGAQSDTPILPEPDQGRQQKRIYIDNIGVKERFLILQENSMKHVPEFIHLNSSGIILQSLSVYISQYSFNIILD